MKPEDKNNTQTIKVIKDDETVAEKVNSWVQIIVSLLTVIISGIAVFISGQTISNINQMSQGQQQLQTQVVIEPRDGDIIVHVNDDYKLLQLIQYEDIVFPTKIQEIQIKNENSIIEDRVDISNEDQENWNTRDSFRYMISNFSINPNKVINLLGTIESLTVYCDFYEEKNISTLISLNEDYKYSFKIINGKEDLDIKVSNINEVSKKEYVTNEINDGIEWVKIRVEIVYAIEVNGEVTRITDTIVSDWIPTDADLI